MTNARKQTCLFYDNGLFLHFALKLSEQFGKVLWFNPWTSAYPQPDDYFIGSGFSEIEKIDWFWDHVDEADVICFADVGFGDIQHFLRKKGYNVWGPGHSEDLELSREKLNHALKNARLPSPDYKKIRGFANLKKYLKGKKNLYIKIDGTIRGMIETLHFDNYELASPVLDHIESKISGYENLIDFIIEKPINATEEAGTDTYCIDGKFPRQLVLGYEVKESSYAAKVVSWNDYPEMMRRNLEKLSPLLKKNKYRGFLSTEEKITKNKSYLIDICTRMGYPSGGTHSELVSNWSDIIYQGARGVLVEPRFKAKYAAEAIIVSEYAQDNHNALHFPDKIKQLVKLLYAIKKNGVIYTIPKAMGAMGSLTATGDSIDECWDKINRMKKNIHGYDLLIDMEKLETALSMLKNGINNI